MSFVLEIYVTINKDEYGSVRGIEKGKAIPVTGCGCP
jgi:hypothetical protein